MSSKTMSFKAKINNYAKQHKIAAQVVLQNCMFERFWRDSRNPNIRKISSLKAECSYLLSWA